ncbi:dephospho-CoA kinase [bacterium]|nr:dephospho-CoA kinase [bacterium]MBT4291280.1 dephospho-CoA kinase [bacterium]MBT7311817.1 dephospho-CoA kinase [bacterium]
MSKKMKLWAIAGPIAAGKSTLVEILSDAGAYIIDADKLGHRVLEQAEIIEAIKCEFGIEYTDRSILSELVFSDSTKLKKLNQIVRPQLEAAIIKSIEKVSSMNPQPPLAVLDAAVYFQFTSLPKMDLTISVTASEELRVMRLMDRNDLSQQQAQARIESQRDLYAGFLEAEMVMVNDGTEEQFKEVSMKFVDEKYPHQ